ncbi:MAG: response regulator [Rhodobacteraceae bacterium]|nr:response regulator [Paracoccaceae bacterium]
MATRKSDNFEMMRSGLNLIQQALSIYDSDLKLAVCNRRFQEMFNLPEELVTPGSPFDETIRFLARRGDYGDVAEIETFVSEKVEQALAFEPHYVERQRANGTTISVEGSPLRTGGWVTVYTDITEIKQQEELLRSHSAQLSDQLLDRSEKLAQTNRQLAATISALEETKHQLIESEARTRMTSEMTPAHIARLDRNEVYTYSNRRLREVIPDRSGEIVGLNACEALGEEAYRKIKPNLDQAFAGTGNVFEFDLGKGNRRVRVAFTPDFGPGGEVVGAYILSMDITQEAQARAVLMQTRKRELAAQLASGLAHDFSNLLTIIVGLQGKMERLPDLPVTAQEAIGTTKAAALRGGMLLDRLSDISGRRELTASAVKVDDLFDTVSAMIAATLPNSVSLEFINENVADTVLMDQGFMQDALINMVLNARDAISGTGAITVATRTRGTTWLEFEVSDTGPGFSDEALERGLDPFFTTKAGEGSGLGLTMIYDFAQLSGGRIRISNIPDGGACVSVQLPLRITTGVVPSGMVLLVEDTEEIRTSVRTMLRDIGHSVLEADSAEEALALARVPGVTHVLSDIMLSGKMNGLEMVEAIKDAGLDVPTIMMTGLPPQDPARKTAGDKFALLPKPFSQEQLRAVFAGLQP